VLFVLEPSGLPVPLKTAAEAIGSGLLVAADDGLFGAASSQTWSAT
jgi:hypothetical protein